MMGLSIIVNRAYLHQRACGCDVRFVMPASFGGEPDPDKLNASLKFGSKIVSDDEATQSILLSSVRDFFQTWDVCTA
jgi:hypothetical protein